MADVLICCGQQPLEQVRRGRRVRFCIRCGTTYDVAGETIRERMRDELLKIFFDGPRRR